MKNKEIEKLWVAVNKLRGGYEVTILYKLMLYALFFKDLELEKNKINSYDEKFTLKYLSLTYGKIVDPLEVAEQLRNIENDFALTEGVLAESFNSIFRQVEPENVRIIFEIINQLDLDSKKDIYEMAKQVLERMAIAGGKASGEFSTSESLMKIATALIDVENGMSVYDGCCGTGVLVNELANGKGTVFAQDLSISTIGVATIMTIVSGNKIGAIKCADSLYNPIEYAEKYDRVICDPPLGGRYSKEYIVNIPAGNIMYESTSDSRTLFLRHALAKVKDDGIVAITVPMGVLFSSGSTGEFRQELVENNYIDAIVEFPSGIMMPYSSVTTALVILKKNKTNDNIIMINSKEFFDKQPRTLTISDENVQRLVDIYRKGEIIEGISNIINKEQAAVNQYNLCTTQYVTLKAAEGIVLEDNVKFSTKYSELLQQLKDIDKELVEMRGRFM